MVSPLLTTKLYPPPVRVGLIHRPRLLEWLNACLEVPLTLICAPAGYGKSTLLAEWISDRRFEISDPRLSEHVNPQSEISHQKFCWFSLDEGDNDPVRFLAYLLAGLDGAQPGLVTQARSLAEAPQPLPLQAILAVLVNELQDLRAPVCLVLDDYQFITYPGIHTGIAFLLDHLPPALHLVIATRSDPALPLARLRARQQLIELRLADLRFTPPEAAEFLQQAVGIPLSTSDLATLEERTEGWIAGLQLAAISMQGRSDLSGFIRAFSGSHRFILDYLVEEVLNRQPEEIRTFLLQTSVLERLCGELCDAVLESRESRVERSDHSRLSTLHSRDVLDHLDRANLFLIPLDDERRWYRYHHLFADLLRARLEQGYPNAVLGLHRRASRWFEQNAFPAEAVEHALKGQDFPQAARLIEQAAQELWIKGEYHRLRRWIEALPEGLVHSRPWLCIWNAWALTQTGALDDIRAWVETARQAAEREAAEAGVALSSTDPAFPGIQALAYEVTTLQAFAAGLALEGDRAVELAARVLDHPPALKGKSALFARCHTLHVLSSLYYSAGDLDRAEQACLETSRLSQEIGFTLRYIHAVNKLAYIARTRGHLRLSYGLLQATLSQLQQQGMANAFAVGILHCRLADVLVEWGRDEEAQRLIGDAIEPDMLAGVPYLLVDRYNVQARLHLLEQEPIKAQYALNQAAALARQALIWPALAWQTETLQVRLWLQQGDLSLAAAWASEHPPDYHPPDNHPPDGYPADPSALLLFSSESREVARARVLLAQGANLEAVHLLDRLARSAETGGRKGSLVEIATLKAAVLQSIGEGEQALAALERALALGEPEGYQRTFVDEGRLITPLLARMAHGKLAPHRRYARQLLAAIEGGESPSRPVVRPPGMEAGPGERTPGGMHPVVVEPLSKRELEVLQLMALGRTNLEIARHLIVSPGTVKAQTASIYRKLDVANRTEAVARARQLGLLP